jgi:preprotein translocase subunit SecG
MRNKYSNIKIPIYIILVVIILWVSVAVAIFLLLPSWSDRGNFGSMFGAISSLFTGTALAGVTYTVYLQQNELLLQRTTADATIQQMQGTAQAQLSAEKSLQEQIQIQNLALQLSALSSILSHYDQQVLGTNGIEKQNARGKIDALLIDVESIRNEIQKISPNSTSG